jgi:hypothetical protein
MRGAGGKAINAGVARGGPAPKREPRAPRGRGRGRGAGGGEPNSVTAPPTWKTINRNVRASANLKFRPLERAIGGEIRASRQRQHEEGDWWQNYLNTVSAGQADTSAAYQQALGTQQAQMGQASAIDTANTTRLQGEAAQSAELRGAAPSAAPAEREAAAQAQRNYLASAQAGSTALSGAIQRGYLNEQKRIGVGQSIKSRQEEQRRERGYRKDRRETRRERGDYAATKRAEEQKEARDYAIQRGAFGLDKRKANLEAKEGARSAQESALERGEKRRQQEIENRQEGRKIRQDQEEHRRRERERGESGKEGGKTPSERNAAQEGRRNAMATARSLYGAAKKPPRTAQQWAAFETLVASESEVSPAEARWAVKRLRQRVSGTGSAQGGVHR